MDHALAVATAHYDLMRVGYVFAEEKYCLGDVLCNLKVCGEPCVLYNLGTKEYEYKGLVYHAWDVLEYFGYRDPFPANLIDDVLRAAHKRRYNGREPDPQSLQMWNEAYQRSKSLPNFVLEDYCKNHGAPSRRYA